MLKLVCIANTSTILYITGDAHIVWYGDLIFQKIVDFLATHFKCVLFVAVCSYIISWVKCSSDRSIGGMLLSWLGTLTFPFFFPLFNFNFYYYYCYYSLCECISLNTYFMVTFTHLLLFRSIPFSLCLN